MRSSLCRISGLAFFWLLAWSVPGRGQIVIDHRPNIPIARSYEVREVEIDARVRDQVAEVQVSQSFHNPGSSQLEAEFYFPLPDDGAIRNFVLMVDGKELTGRLLPKDEARRIYEGIVRSKRDPALLEYMGRGLYRTSVFPIPPHAERKVTMRYTQLLKRDRDVVELNYPLASNKYTGKPIQRLTLTMRIESQTAIKSLYSPSHDAEIHRDGDHHAKVKLVQHDVIPTSDFRLIYTLAEGDLGATVLSTWPSASEDGYFLLLASPKVRAPDQKPKPKTVVFVLDRSGSMSGKKIQQARDSLKFVLNNLRDDDLFNIVVYDDRVETYKPELQRYNSDARAAAIRYVENIQPGGSTNIDAALRTALEQLQDDDRPNYVLFLTDGLPTAGETREVAIAERARAANKAHARLFVFGVGFDVNARLLDRLSGGNSGASEYVRPDEDIEAKVGRFFAKLTSPVLANLNLELSGTDVNRTYPRDLPDLFEGGQLVWVGRYRRAGRSTVRLSGKVSGERQSFEFPADLAEPGRGSSYDFVEKLWAVRRIGFILDQIDLHGKNSELIDELVELSKKHGILTPYTSFLADENVNLHAGVEFRRRAMNQLSELDVAGGVRGVGQRAAKQDYLYADRIGRGGLAGMGGGMGGMGSAMKDPGAQALSRAAGESVTGPAVSNFSVAQAGTPVLAKSLEGRDVLVTTVRNLGGKTFYRRDNRWVDSEVTAREEQEAIAIEQFSDAFFKLAASQGAEQNQWLTFTEPVVVKIDDKVYRIELPRP